MAEGPVQVQISVATDESIQQLRAFDHGLLTTLIRAIIREELEVREQRQLEAQGQVTPIPLQGFTFIHEYDPSREFIRLPEGSSLFLKE